MARRRRTNPRFAPGALGQGKDDGSGPQQKSGMGGWIGGFLYMICGAWNFRSSLCTLRCPSPSAELPIRLLVLNFRALGFSWRSCIHSAVVKKAEKEIA